MDIKKMSLEELRETVARQADKILSLEIQLGVNKQKNEKEQLRIPAQLAEIDGKRYRFTAAAFIFEGVRWISEEVLFEEAVLKRLLQLEGQGILKEVF